MPTEQRRVGFPLPPEVFAQLLDEVFYDDSTERELDFWEKLRSYYALSPLQGDSVICDPSFLEYITQECGEDPPRWVHTQPLRKMQCMIIAGPGRGETLLATLRQIERLRDQDDTENENFLDATH